MAVTLVQQNGTLVSNGGATTATAALPGASTTGNTLVVGITWTYNSGTPTPVVTDGTNTFTALPSSRVISGVPPGGFIVASEFFYCQGITGLPTETITVTFATGAFAWVMAWELTPSQFDQLAANQGITASGPTACTAGTLTPSSNGAFACAIAQMNDGIGAGSDWSANAGWTKDHDYAIGSVEEGGAHIAQSTAAPLTMGLQHIGFGTWVASGVTFVTPGGTPSVASTFSVSDPAGFRIPGIH